MARTKTARLRKGKSRQVSLLTVILVTSLLFILISLILLIERKTEVDVVIITLDTTRWDYIRLYQEKGPRTPNLGRIAAAGALFWDATTVTPLTLPAHTSLFTGLYPSSHGVRNNGTFVLSENVATLAGLLSERGYETAAVIGSFVLDSRFGLARDFDHYDDDIGAISKGEETFIRMNLSAERSAKSVTDRAIQWLRKEKDTPFFLWVHYYDPHYPYRPPSPFDKEYAEDPYAGEIACIDHEIGRLIPYFLSDDKEERTAVIVLGDHGESLGEHGEATHGLFLYESSIRIPLIMVLPGVTVPGSKVESTARIIDIMPTLLDYLDIEPPEGLDGVSLIPSIREKTPIKRETIAETLYPELSFGWSSIFCLRKGTYKYILAPRPELYDLSRDPLEEVNLAGELPEIEEEMSGLIRSYLEKDEERSISAGRGMDTETADKLRSLGYIWSPVRSVGKELPDPKDMVEIKALLTEGQFLMNEGRLYEALDKFRGTVRRDPKNPSPYNQIGLIYYQMDVLDSALYYLKQAEAMDSTIYSTHHNLASLYERMGQLDLARRGYEKAIALNPSSIEDMIALADVQLGMGDLKEAHLHYKKALSMEVENPKVYLGLAEIAKRRGRYKEAIDRLNEGIKKTVPSPELHNKLGTIYQLLGDTEEALAEYERALRINPDHLDAIFNRGSIRTERGLLDGALADFSRLLEFDEYRPRSLFFIGLIYEKKGDKEAAIKKYSEFLSTWEGEEKMRNDVQERIRKLKES